MKSAFAVTRRHDQVWLVLGRVRGMPVPKAKAKRSIQVPYRLRQLQHVGLVGEGAAVAGVAHQRARQEHGPQIVAVQDVHGQRGGGRAPLAGVGRSVLR